MNYASIFQAVTSDPRYVRNIEWGQPRPGHPEGSIGAHIAELEANLNALRHKFTETEIWKLKLLIHVHDLFKAEARADVPIVDPASHASLARAFLAEYCPDRDLLAMVQFHDEAFALWRQMKFRHSTKPQRLEKLIATIQDWNLFLAFLIIDGCTLGKSRAALRWFFNQIKDRVTSVVTEADIID